jgi:hypothetical protein
MAVVLCCLALQWNCSHSVVMREREREREDLARWDQAVMSQGVL